MWTPPKGAKAVEPVRSEFWKPETPGEVLIGKLVRIRPSRNPAYPNDTAEIEPAVIIPKEGDSQLYAGMGVSINSWLAKLIRPSMVRQYFAICYKGNESTPNGNMRTFAVFPVEAEGPEGFSVIKAKAHAVVSGEPEESADDLPF